MHIKAKYVLFNPTDIQPHACKQNDIFRCKSSLETKAPKIYTYWKLKLELKLPPANLVNIFNSFTTSFAIGFVLNWYISLIHFWRNRDIGRRIAQPEIILRKDPVKIQDESTFSIQEILFRYRFKDRCGLF